MESHKDDELPKDISFKLLKPRMKFLQVSVQDAIIYKELSKLVYIAHYKYELSFVDTAKNVVLKKIGCPTPSSGTGNKPFYSLLKHPNKSEYPYTFFVSVGGGKVFTFCAKEERKIGELVKDENGVGYYQRIKLVQHPTLPHTILHVTPTSREKEKSNRINFLEIEGQQNSKVKKSIVFYNDFEIKIEVRGVSTIVFPKTYENCFLFNYYDDSDDDFVTMIDYEKKKEIKRIEFGKNYVNGTVLFQSTRGTPEILIVSEEEELDYVSKGRLYFFRLSDKQKLMTIELGEDNIIDYFLIFGNKYLFSFDVDFGFMYGYELNYEDDKFSISKKFKKKTTQRSVKKCFCTSTSSFGSVEKYADFTLVSIDSLMQIRINGISNPLDNRLRILNLQDLKERIEFILEEKEIYIFDNSSFKFYFSRICLKNVNLENILKVLL